MNVIDIHTHAFPDSLAPRAIAALEEPIDWKSVGDGTISGLLASMDAAGVRASVICSIATRPEQVEPILRWSRQAASDRIIPFASIHPDTPDVDGCVKRIAEAGFRGIKLHPMYQNFAVDDPRMDRIYDAIRDSGLLLEVHSGCDIAFPGDERASVARLVSLIERHPRLRLICTHLGAWKCWDEVEQSLVGRDLYLETSFSLQWCEPAQVERIIRRHGLQRVMFGTDWPWAAQDQEVELLHSLGLSEAEKQAILHDNAAALLGL